jgi:MFS family permease
MRLVAIVAVTVLAHAAFNASRITVSLYALSLGASALVVGALMSLYAALPMVLSLPAGRFVDRVGVRLPLVASVFALAISVSIPGWLPGLAPLYVAAAVIGTAFMVFHLSVQHLVGEMSAPHERQANFGWLALGFSISNFVGPLVAGLAIDGLGHGSAFLIECTLALAALAVIVARRAGLRHEPHGRGAEGAGSLRTLLADPELRRVFLVTGILASAWDLFVFAMPIYGTSIGLSATTIGLVIGSFALATFVVRLALPFLSRRVREWTLITATLFVAGSAYALMPLMHTVPLLAITAFALGLGLGATQPSLMSLLYATAPAGRAAEAVGVRSTVLNASHTFLPLAFGGLGAFLGMAPVFWTMSAFLVAGGCFARRRRRLGAR